MDTPIVKSLRLVTAPEVEPVSLADMREHLRLVPSGSPLAHADDALITSLITAARQHLDGKDGILGRCLIEQVWELTLDKFPDNEIQIPLCPLISVDHVYYDDAEGAEQEVSVGDYQVDSRSEPGWIVPVSGVSWPDTIDGINAVRIEFTAGYGDEAGDVPATIIAAIKLIVGMLYANREPGPIDDSITEILLKPYLVGTL